MAIFTALFDTVLNVYILSFCGVMKSLKSCRSWKISERSVTGLRIGQFGPLERTRIISQSGYRVPDWEAWKRNNYYIDPDVLLENTHLKPHPGP